MPKPPRPRFPEQAPFIGRPLREAFVRLMDEINAGVSERYDFATPALNRVMVLIDADGSRLTDLADRAQMTKQSMAELVNRMEEIGLVERRPDPADGRAKLVFLTPFGWEAARTGLEVALGVHERWQALIGERKTTQLVGLLSELVEKLDAEPPG